LAHQKLLSKGSPWGFLVILVPVVGGLIVTLLVTKFAPEARGHGVPEVMDAIYYSEGRIRPVVAAVKSLASSISIGTGAAVGREGPIIQIGASLGSTIGQIISLAAWQRITLVAADRFVEALAMRIASFDKQAIAEIKRLVDIASLPTDAEIVPEWDAFIASVGRPASQTRLKALMERGFHRAGDVENRLGYYVGQVSAASVQDE
jgi:Voltage gated chloride channel